MRTQNMKYMFKAKFIPTGMFLHYMGMRDLEKVILIWVEIVRAHDKAYIITYSKIACQSGEILPLLWSGG